MAKRMIVMLTVTALLVAGLGFVKFKQIQTAVAQGAAFQPPPEAVTTIVALQEQWPATLSAIGTVAAVQGVTVSADLPGTVERIGFDSGKSVREGEVLALLDTKQEQAQLAAAEAQRELTRLNFDRLQGLLSERVISRAEFDRATAEQRQADARANEIRAAIERKTIPPPFSGLRDQLRAVRQLGLRRHRSEKPQRAELSRSAPAVRQAGWRARRSDRHHRRRQGRRRGRHLGCLQASQWRRGAGQQQSAAGQQ